MSALVLGLLLFLSTHSARFFAAANRAQYIDHYGMASGSSPTPSSPSSASHSSSGATARRGSSRCCCGTRPLWTRHLAALLTLPAFVLVAAAYVPGTVIKARLGHPMMAGVKLGARPPDRQRHARRRAAVRQLSRLVDRGLRHFAQDRPRRRAGAPARANQPRRDRGRRGAARVVRLRALPAPVADRRGALWLKPAAALSARRRTRAPRSLPEIPPATASDPAPAAAPKPRSCRSRSTHGVSGAARGCRRVWPARAKGQVTRCGLAAGAPHVELEVCLPPGIDGHAALQLPDVERALEMQPALLEPGAAAIGPTGLMRTSS